jgi:hypothetical protein
MMGGGGMGGILASPPTVVVSGDYVYVVWLGQLSQYKVADLSLVKTIQLPMPQGGMMGRGGRQHGGADGAPPPPPAAQ